MPTRFIDVFNGDGDGICALHQLRLAEPRDSAELVTGVKRDIRLLDRLAGVSDAEITVLDISLETNRAPLLHLLPTNRVRYFDHHHAGALVESPNLELHIHPEPELCTSLIVNRLLGGRSLAWAVAGAFGDNLHEAARTAAAPLGLDETGLAQIREVGELLNYNGYGRTTSDLYFHPATLYSALKPFADPRDFLASSPALARLREGFQADLEQARRTRPFLETEGAVAFRLPDQPWCRRVAGVYMNEMAREDRRRAHALLVENGNSTLLVSLRAPLDNRRAADEVCRAFPTGGGRPAAAGVNELPEERLPGFLKIFTDTYPAG